MNALAEQLQKTLDLFTGDNRECGCQLAIFQRGKLLCNLCSGKDAVKGTPITPHRLFPMFSTGKGIIATLVHILKEKGLLSYDDPVVKYWPAYGCNGKEKTTLRHVLSHRAGMSQFGSQLSPQDKYQWETAWKSLETMAPLSEIGGMHRYHALTFGILAGHIAELAAGIPLPQLLKKEIFAPLEIRDLFFGIPEKRLKDRVDIDGNGYEDYCTQCNVPHFYQGTNPSACGFGTALELAKIYSALGQPGYNGVQLLSAKTIQEATQLCRCPEDTDLTSWAKFGLGYALCGPSDNLGRMFGHGGADGSEGFYDKETGYAVGFVKNRTLATHPVHPVRDAISDVLGLPHRIW